MNLLEAIQDLGENWFRPKTGYFTGEGFSNNHGTIYLNRSNGSCIPYFTESVWFLTGEWEIVTPEQVLSERKL